MIKKKVMVEVGDLEKLKSAIESMEGLKFLGEEETILVDLAKRVVAAEEKIKELIDAPADISSY